MVIKCQPILLIFGQLKRGEGDKLTNPDASCNSAESFAANCSDGRSLSQFMVKNDQKNAAQATHCCASNLQVPGCVQERCLGVSTGN